MWAECPHFITNPIMDKWTLFPEIHNYFFLKLRHEGFLIKAFYPEAVGIQLQLLQLQAVHVLSLQHCNQ